MSPMRLEFILFGVLLQQPKTGYDLKKFMDTTGRFMRVNTAMTQVYRSLRRMEGHGWVAHTIEPRPGAQDAKRFHVTPKGEAVFMGWLTQAYESTEPPGDPEFFARVRFRAAFLGRDAVLDLLDTEIRNRKAQIARNRDRDRTEIVDPTVPFDEELAGALADWEHHRGVARMDAHLEACIELRDTLARGEIPRDDCPNPLQRLRPVSDAELEQFIEQETSR